MQIPLNKFQPRVHLEMRAAKIGVEGGNFFERHYERPLHLHRPPHKHLLMNWFGSKTLVVLPSAGKTLLPESEMKKSKIKRKNSLAGP